MHTSPSSIPGELPRPSISVADRVARAFSPLACVKGYLYYSKKRVDLVERSDDAVDADVKGARIVKVVLRITGGRLAASCTCTPTLVGPPACRHVWATLLEVDRCGVLSPLRTSARSMALEPIVSPPSRRSPRASAPPPEAPAPRRRGRPRS